MITELEGYGRPPKMDRILTLFSASAACLCCTLICGWIVAAIEHDMWGKMFDFLLVMPPLIVTIAISVLFSFGFY